MNRHSHRRPFAIFPPHVLAALIGLLLCLAGPLPGEARAAVPEGLAAGDSPSSAEVVPEGLSTGDWAGIRGAYEAGRHAVRPVGSEHRAENPGQRWLTRFDGRGFSVQPDAGGWNWGLELVRYGFPGEEREVEGPAGVRAAGQRAVYAWDDTLEEWYQNDTRGLEHGYTVHRRPPQDAPGLLGFTLAVRGGLRPEVSADGRDVAFLDADGGTAVVYNGLTVVDAGGRELPARFETVASGLRLLLDERGARYPITIDPVSYTHLTLPTILRV